LTAKELKGFRPKSDARKEESCQSKKKGRKTNRTTEDYRLSEEKRKHFTSERLPMKRNQVLLSEKRGEKKKDRQQKR
jgi:hypothetical protein